MKKIIVFTGILALAFTGCKKDESPVNPAATTSLNELAARFIQKTDPKVYNEIYNSSDKSPKPTVKIAPGAFVVIGGNPDNGTCLPSHTVCFVDIIFNKFVDGTTTTITSPFSEQYDPNTAEIMLNGDSNQEFYIKSINVSFVQGQLYASWVRQ